MPKKMKPKTEPEPAEPGTPKNSRRLKKKRTKRRLVVLGGVVTTIIAGTLLLPIKDGYETVKTYWPFFGHPPRSQPLSQPPTSSPRSNPVSPMPITPAASIITRPDEPKPNQTTPPKPATSVKEGSLSLRTEDLLGTFGRGVPFGFSFGTGKRVPVGQSDFTVASSGDDWVFAMKTDKGGFVDLGPMAIDRIGEAPAIQIDPKKPRYYSVGAKIVVGHTYCFTLEGGRLYGKLFVKHFEAIGGTGISLLYSLDFKFDYVYEGIADKRTFP